MIKVAIIDDDADFQVILLKELENIARIERLHIKADLITDFEELDSSQALYDVYFMDIDLPERTGIDLARKLRKQGVDSEIIFVSAHENFMRVSMQVRPVAFVRKSHLVGDLKEAVKIIRESWIYRERKAVIYDNKKKLLVNPTRIVYWQSMEHYIRINYDDDQYTMLRNSLNKIEKDMEDFSFLRVHVRYLVNLEFIDMIKGFKVHMKNGVTIPVSNKYHQAVQEQLFDWFERRRN